MKALFCVTFVGKFYKVRDGMNALNSVTVTLLWNGEESNYDLCPKCMKRMNSYLKKEAKRNKDNE